MTLAARPPVHGGGSLLLATRSAGKLRELAALCDEAGIAWQSLASLGVPEDADAEEAVECHDTFLANARAKAAWYRERSGASWVLAEDSGLCVDALGGAPGVQSKRWGGAATERGVALEAANIVRVQKALAAVDAETEAARRAAYVCVAVVQGPDGVSFVGEGRTAGHLLRAPRGSGGFGYDPIFWSDELGAAFGEVSASAKAAVSHRGRAVRAAVGSLKDFLGTR